MGTRGKVNFPLLPCEVVFKNYKFTIKFGRVEGKQIFGEKLYKQNFSDLQGIFYLNIEKCQKLTTNQKICCHLKMAKSINIFGCLQGRIFKNAH